MELKTMVTSASVYIFNYVLLMLRVHSPLPDGEGYTALLLNSTKHALSAGVVGEGSDSEWRTGEPSAAPSLQATSRWKGRCGCARRCCMRS